MNKNITLVCVFLLSTLIIGCNSESQKIKIDAPTADQTIEEYIESQQFSGAILLAQDGDIQLNKGFGKANSSTQINNDADTVFRLASVSKQFTAMAIMILQEQGLLTIEDTVAMHISDYPQGDIITLKHLLTHTAGIQNYTALSNHVTTQQNHHTPEELIAIFKDLPLEFSPGSEYKYSNSGYALLGLIIEKVSGQSYRDFIQQAIFLPLDMQRSDYAGNHQASDNIATGYMSSGSEANAIDMSVPYAAGALVSTLNDLYKWDQSFYNNTLVSQETKEEMLTPHLSEYGYGWVIGNLTGTGELNYSHTGGINGFSTIIIRFPDTKKLIVILSNVESYPTAQMALQLNSFM